MSVQNNFMSWSIQASEALNDLTAGTGDIYKAVDMAGGIASDNTALGILQYGADNGGHVSVGIYGIMKYVASAAVGAGADLTVTTSGYFTTAASGDTAIFGRNLTSSVASGAVGTGLFDFSGSKRFDVDSSAAAALVQLDFTSQDDLSVALSAGKFANISSGDFATAPGNDAGAVIISGADSGGSSKGQVQGMVSVRAGGVVALGESITTANSGWAVKADSGDMILGRAMAASAAGNSGSTFNAVIDMANPHYATSSLDVQYL